MEKPKPMEDKIEDDRWVEEEPAAVLALVEPLVSWSSMF